MSTVSPAGLGAVLTALYAQGLRPYDKAAPVTALPSRYINVNASVPYYEGANNYWIVTNDRGIVDLGSLTLVLPMTVKLGNSSSTTPLNSTQARYANGPVDITKGTEAGAAADQSATYVLAQPHAFFTDLHYVINGSDQPKHWTNYSFRTIVQKKIFDNMLDGVDNGAAFPIFNPKGNDFHNNPSLERNKYLFPFTSHTDVYTIPVSLKDPFVIRDGQYMFRGEITVHGTFGYNGELGYAQAFYRNTFATYTNASNLPYCTLTQPKLRVKYFKPDTNFMQNIVSLQVSVGGFPDMHHMYKMKVYDYLPSDYQDTKIENLEFTPLAMMIIPMPKFQIQSTAANKLTTLQFGRNNNIVDTWEVRWNTGFTDKQVTTTDERQIVFTRGKHRNPGAEHCTRAWSKMLHGDFLRRCNRSCTGEACEVQSDCFYLQKFSFPIIKFDDYTDRATFKFNRDRVPDLNINWKPIGSFTSTDYHTAVIVIGKGTHHYNSGTSLYYNTLAAPLHLADSAAGAILVNQQNKDGPPPQPTT